MTTGRDRKKISEIFMHGFGFQDGLVRDSCMGDFAANGAEHLVLTNAPRWEEILKTSCLKESLEELLPDAEACERIVINL